MHEGKSVLLRIKKKWMLEILFSRLLLALSFSIFISTILYRFSLLNFLPALLLFGFLFFLVLLINRQQKLSELNVSRFLNIANPSLQESTELVLKPHASLNLLEKLQVKKVEKELLALESTDPFKKQFTISLLVFLIATLICFGLFKIPLNINFLNNSGTTKQIFSGNSFPEIKLAEIKNTNITISSPTYTGKGSRQQSAFNLSAEEGSMIYWEMQTNIAAKEVKLIFNDGTVLQLKTDARHLNWSTQKQVKIPGFYQVKIDNKLSDLYKIEAIKDKPPTINIQSPAANTSITYGQNQRVILKTILADDYGISAADISATVSSGEGEAVKFKEQKLSFENFAAGNKEYHLQKTIDCKALGMQPGDELYFFIRTTDNHKQETRSEVYIITLQDTTSLTSLDGIVLPLDIKPELFRSQRQIIIETEQLIKNKSTISTEAFKKKSDELGFDQNLLRIRYGKFLGEETNVELGDNHDEGNQGFTNNAAEIIEKFTHEHDNAEDASFFDAATKKQLIATLDEMWKAELKLKTFLPKEALPFEYKALLLLKDLQQKSRAYVPKTGFKSTPLKLDKRLSGDLTKITQPQTQEDFKNPEAASTILRKALGILEQLKTNTNINVSSKEILQQAFQQLSIIAANQPSVYLTSLSALKKILGDNYLIKDIDNAEQGLQKMSPATDKLPYSKENASTDLSKQYFINLNKSRQ